jgi:hypothetical protein
MKARKAKNSGREGKRKKGRKEEMKARVCHLYKAVGNTDTHEMPNQQGSGLLQQQITVGASTGERTIEERNTDLEETKYSVCSS